MIAVPAMQQENASETFQSQLYFATCAFLAGLLCAFNIPMVGSFPAAEFVLGVVSVSGFFMLFLTQRATFSLFTSRWLWIFVLAQFLTLMGYGIADFYRSSAPLDAARGWSRIIFLSIDTAAIALLFGEDRRNLRLLLIGASLSGIVAVLLSGAQYGDVWKFGYAWPVTILVILCGSRFGPWLTIGALLILGGVHYVYDFRSLCAICLLVATMLMVQMFERQQRKLVLAVLLFLGFAAFWAFEERSSSMDTSERGARSNVERSSMLIVAWQAFVESPWIGQGSWFSNSNVMPRFLDLRSEAADEAGVHGYSTDESDEKIAIHSQLLVSLAEGGILGGVFFVLYGLSVSWALWYNLFTRHLDCWSAIYLLLLISALWNLLMSPFSGGHRINIAVSIGIVLLLLQERERLAEVQKSVGSSLGK